MRSVTSRPVVGPFADRLLEGDLPALPTERRRAAVTFIIRRVDGLPSFTRFGVMVISSCFRLLLALPGGWPAARWLTSKPLPLLAEYPRIVRSLGYAYIWETWPATLPDGAPA